MSSREKGLKSVRARKQSKGMPKTHKQIEELLDTPEECTHARIAVLEEILDILDA